MGRPAQPSSWASAWDRVAWLAALLSSLSVLAAARWLTPSPSGVGTHEQLGLPPCGMLAWLGVPCPACGMTTSFAHLADGDVLAAFRAHPLAPFLFVATCLAVPGALYAMTRGLSVMAAIERLQADRLSLYFAIAVLLVWVARLALWV
ncbi:MAG: DUF2752 domain-containing protein [Myxococcales bacterium]